MRDLDATTAAWAAAGHGYDTPEYEAREAVFARLRAWNVEQAATPIDKVRLATRAKQDGETADQLWREAIRAAIAAGVRVVEIAEAAGVTRDRVYQIRDDRR